MDVFVKYDWVDALRSGKFPQGVGRLRYGNPKNPKRQKWCCLGVLCKVLEPNTYWKWEPFPLFSAARFHGFELSLTRNHETYTTDLIDSIGLTLEQHSTLVDMNDDEVPFDDIADYIEWEIPGEYLG